MKPLRRERADDELRDVDDNPANRDPITGAPGSTLWVQAWAQQAAGQPGQRLRRGRRSRRRDVGVIAGGIAGGLAGKGIAERIDQPWKRRTGVRTTAARTTLTRILITKRMSGVPRRIHRLRPVLRHGGDVR